MISCQARPRLDAVCAVGSGQWAVGSGLWAVGRVSPSAAAAGMAVWAVCAEVTPSEEAAIVLARLLSHPANSQSAVDLVPLQWDHFSCYIHKPVLYCLRLFYPKKSRN